MQLSGSVCLVTGCSRGIGKATVERFCQEGATVYAHMRTRDEAEKLKVFFEDGFSGIVHPVYFDVVDCASMRQCISDIKKAEGKLDVVVNNAGVMQDAPIGMISDEMMEHTFRVNVFAVMHLIQYASKLMRRQKSGSIINIASIMGAVGNKNQMLYSASKGAVISLTKSAAKELAPCGIRVNAIAPGVVDTDLFRQIGLEKSSEFVAKIGMGRAGSPREIADLCVFLASDSSAYVTGQVIGIDGSMVV